jgi:hypothetical protein
MPLLLLLLMMLMLIILELIKAPHLNTTIQGAPHSFLYPFIKSLLFQKNNLFLSFLFSVQTANISLTSSSISSDVKSRYTNTFYSTVHQSPPQKNFFRAATHAADNNQIGTRDPRLKPSPADAAHIW